MRRRGLLRAMLIVLASAGGLSGCYYDPYTGGYYPYPPYPAPYTTARPIRTGRRHPERRTLGDGAAAPGERTGSADPAAAAAVKLTYFYFFFFFFKKKKKIFFFPKSGLSARRRRGRPLLAQRQPFGHKPAVIRRKPILQQLRALDAVDAEVAKVAPQLEPRPRP